jgi:glycosyltransferase involved in cell wall biosynthesis
MPVYNEEAALPGVLEEAWAALAPAPFRFEIVLVDDASTDRSLQILLAFQGRHPEAVRILQHQCNLGIAAACQTLYAAARGRYVFLNASDGQVRTAECLRLMHRRDRYDLVVGGRRHKRYSLGRALISGLFNLLPLMLFGVRTYDAGSVKLIRTELLAIPLVSEGPFREAERIIRARWLGYRIGQVLVEHRQRVGGRASGARLSTLWTSARDVLRCWWSLSIRGGALTARSGSNSSDVVLSSSPRP